MLMRAGSQPAGATAPQPSRSQMHALRADLLDADDAKIRQIVAMLEASAEPRVRQAVLDPLRSRLTSLKPPRTLRFTRLLFMPLDGLIVPASEWRPGQATIPRSVLEAMSQTVQAAFGGDIAAIEMIVTGHNTDQAEVVTRAGLSVWSRAGEILGQLPAPVGWADTGCRHRCMRRSPARSLRCCGGRHRCATWNAMPKLGCCSRTNARSAR